MTAVQVVRRAHGLAHVADTAPPPEAATPTAVAEVEKAAAPLGDEIGAAGVGEDHHRAELRLDSAGGAVDDHALPLLQLEPVVVGRLRGGLGAGDDARRDEVVSNAS